MVKHIQVYGKVQGVGFRYFTYMMATQLNIDGWAKNCGDGSVEILAHGSDLLMEQFIGQVSNGPRFAHVEGIEVEEISHDGPWHGFSIK